MSYEPKKIPVVLLSGFLGAGKTTALNRWIQAGIEPNSLIIVNDFGQLNIDAELIDYEDEQIIRLQNGCVCCTLGGSMAEKMAEIGRLSPAPSQVYMELSGIADSAKIVDMIRVSQRFVLRDNWCFVDASLAAQHSVDELVNTVWERQIKSATQLVINRCLPQQPLAVPLADLVEKTRVPVHYEMMPTMESATSIRPAPAIAAASSGWHSLSVESEYGIQERVLVELLQSYADTLYRAKGRVCLDAAASKGYVVQYTRGQCHCSPTFQVQKTQLVFIGRSLEKLQRLQQKLQALCKKNQD